MIPLIIIGVAFTGCVFGFAFGWAMASRAADLRHNSRPVRSDGGRYGREWQE